MYNRIDKRSFLQWIRTHLFSVVFSLFIIFLIVSVDARVWVIKQLISTGLFNADIGKKEVDKPDNIKADFDFLDERGHLINMASLRGKVVFINFWASWCPPCRAEFPSIMVVSRKFKNHPEVYFLMINVDDHPATAQAYLKKENFVLPIFRINRDVPDYIFNGALPTTIVLDKKGRIRFRHEGFANYGTDNFAAQIKELLNE